VNDRFEKQIRYYPSLVEAAVELKVHSRQIIAENQGKYFYSTVDGCFNETQTRLLGLFFLQLSGFSEILLQFTNFFYS